MGICVKCIKLSETVAILTKWVKPILDLTTKCHFVLQTILGKQKEFHLIKLFCHSGQPMTGHEASPVVYPHGYTAGRQGGVMYQAQQMPHPAPHYVMPVQYAGGPQQHYYVVNHPQGERTAMPPGQVYNLYSKLNFFIFSWFLNGFNLWMVSVDLSCSLTVISCFHQAHFRLIFFMHNNISSY